ncbi:hypothetical protein [Desulfobacterium sp. N47]|uniref:Uncharacterized protein n=1 Tax=uncultured Desulfobacterium sp. TaxID=201089 RepID=E1Y8W3_9BACT|nr:unknown protein [uncultured Desulfobacterium sp.]
MGLLEKEFSNIRAIAHADTAGSRTMDTIIPQKEMERVGGTETITYESNPALILYCFE